MFTVSLQEKLTEEGAFVTVSCLHPGVIFSDLFTNVCLYRVVSPVMKRIFQVKLIDLEFPLHIILLH